MNEKTNSKILTYRLSLRLWAGLRLLLGFILLWAFADKFLGLGFSTCYNQETKSTTIMCADAVSSGGSPTDGWLTNATRGPLEEIYQSMAGNSVVDFLFMAGLLMIGVALILGIVIKIATVSGSVLMFMMWSAVLPGLTNPLVDYHIIYIVIFAGIYVVNDDQIWGLGRWWQSQPIIKKYKFLI